jgi:hypothetical protein
MSMMRTPSSGRREGVGKGRKDFMVSAQEPRGLAYLPHIETDALDWDHTPGRRNPGGASDPAAERL